MIRKYSDEYKQNIVNQVLQNGRTIDAVAKENHHGWKTIEKWIKEYGDMEPEDTNAEAGCGHEDKYSAAYAGAGGRRTTYDIFDVEESIPYLVSEAPMPCLECVRLEAKLEVYKSILERFIGGI